MNFVQKPAYKGYKAYEYLEEGKDYPKIEWAQWDWAGRHVVELEPDQEAMVQEILKKHLTSAFTITLHFTQRICPALTTFMIPCGRAALSAVMKHCPIPILTASSTT